MKEVSSIKPEIDPQTVETLKELLKQAQDGELRSLLFVQGYANGEVAHGWAGTPDLRMIGAIEDAKFNIFSQMYFPVEE